MNLKPALFASYAAAASILGCAGSGASQPASAPRSPVGVTEMQGSPTPTHEAEAATPAPRPPFRINILQASRTNDDYRRVLFTGTRSQVALMAIPAGGDIGVEAHPNVEQLIFITGGQGKAILNGLESPVAAGDLVVAPPGTKHDIVNTGTVPLRIFTVYAPPNHIDSRVHRTKADADADTADEALGRSAR
jgi:mannose-6-phosphate isomerase-like protein (cupin superfamily)